MNKFNFYAFVVSADFLQYLSISKKCFRNTARVSNGLDQNQVQHFVGPDLDPNLLQRLSADKKSPIKEQVNHIP